MTVSTCIATFMPLRDTIMNALRVAVTEFPSIGVSIAVLNFVLRTQETVEFQTIVAWGMLSLLFHVFCFNKMCNNFPKLTKSSERS